MPEVGLRDFRHNGWIYQLEPLDTGMSIPELRWTRSRDGLTEILVLRALHGAVEEYEPARSWTAEALALYDDDRDISTARLKGEQQRMDGSPLVLNKGLRMAVVAALVEGRTLSDIAIKCGRYRKSRSRRDAETSWVLRRTGLFALGKGDPTPWVHSDVLARIARDGLDMAPREVEVP
jgi:hypothetical protein